MYKRGRAAARSGARRARAGGAGGNDARLSALLTRRRAAAPRAAAERCARGRGCGRRRARCPPESGAGTHLRRRCDCFSRASRTLSPPGRAAARVSPGAARLWHWRGCACAERHAQAPSSAQNCCSAAGAQPKQQAQRRRGGAEPRPRVRTSRQADAAARMWRCRTCAGGFVPPIQFLRARAVRRQLVEAKPRGVSARLVAGAAHTERVAQAALWAAQRWGGNALVRRARAEELLLASRRRPNVAASPAM